MWTLLVRPILHGECHWRLNVLTNSRRSQLSSLLEAQLISLFLSYPYFQRNFFQENPRDGSMMPFESETTECVFFHALQSKLRFWFIFQICVDFFGKLIVYALWNFCSVAWTAFIKTTKGEKSDSVSIPGIIKNVYLGIIHSVKERAWICFLKIYVCQSSILEFPKAVESRTFLGDNSVPEEPLLIFWSRLLKPELFEILYRLLFFP